MARGKYAEKSAKRQAELAVTTDLASYQHRVAKLTAENRELREKLAAQERAAKQTERRLRGERDEGVAPQVQALSLTLKAATEERDRARKAERDLIKKADRYFLRFHAHLVDEHNMTPVGAFELLVEWASGEKRLIAVGAERYASDNVAMIRARHARQPNKTHSVGEIVG